MTKQQNEQNVVMVFYLFWSAIAAGFLFHHLSACFMVGFLLAFILKLANSLIYDYHIVHLKLQGKL